MARSRKTPSEVDFSNRGSRFWLRRQPREVSVTIAARSALRLLPHLAADRKERDFLASIALPVFRAAMVAWVGAKYPERRAELAPAADAALPYQARAAVSYAAVAAERAAASAAYTVDVTTTTSAADSAADTTAFAPGSAAADAAVIARADGAGRRALAIEIASATLWPDGMPGPVGDAWAELKEELLAAGNDWDVWVDWYENRLTGQQSLGEVIDLGVATLPDTLWQTGPKTVNAEIKRLIEARPSAQAIPVQGAGPHFVLSPDLRIALAPPTAIDSKDNNLGRIAQLLPLVRQTAADLSGHLNPNTHPELARNLSQYRSAIGNDVEAVAWGVVFGIGVRLENAAAAARREIADRMQEPLEDAAKEALDSLLTMHGPMILATAEGRELMDQADLMLLDRENWVALKEDAQIVAGNLQKASEIIDPTAAGCVDEATGAIAEGTHPERGTAYGSATLKHAATILVPAATLAAFSAGGAFVGDAVGGTFGSAVGGLVGGAATGAGSLIVAERERVRAAARALGSDFDRALGLGRAAMTTRLRRLTPFRRFVIANEEPLRRIALNSTQMRWMLSYIDFIVRTASNDDSAP